MQKALFLDRDGVINVNHGYVYEADNFDWVEGIFALIKRAKAADYLVIVVTNQSGIGRGMYSEADFKDLTAWMCAEIEQRGGKIDDVFYCPHHPSAGQGEYLRDCDCRKPKSGMLTNAAKKWDISLAQSIMVGDKLIDMKCAANASLRHAFLLNTESEASSNAHGGLQKHNHCFTQIRALNEINFSNI
ncbi:D-glycero-beta-D-manno-heptose 1,7-bisphosphate 7-phosphatase [Ningiella sp. W23]|uniref:D-glycero-beta-D-manno-heptose 1,7-bisphosphate 7-phosphatase n=1 Tax=Ningiella sp. W23 TaxID=3023715 RepID=UPI003757711F